MAWYGVKFTYVFTREADNLACQYHYFCVLLKCNISASSVLGRRDRTHYRAVVVYLSRVEHNCRFESWMGCFISNKEATTAFSFRRQIWPEVCRTSLSNMLIYISSYVVYFLPLIVCNPANVQLMCRELALVALLRHAETLPLSSYKSCYCGHLSSLLAAARICFADRICTTSVCSRIAYWFVVSVLSDSIDIWSVLCRLCVRDTHTAETHGTSYAEDLNARDHLGNLDVDGTFILK